MLRKLVSSLTVFALALVGITQAIPAQAWPDSTTQVGTLTSTDSRWEIGAVGKTLASNMVYAYVGGQDENRYIRAYTLSPEGNLTEPVDIARSNTSDVFFQFSPSESSWVDLDGTINLLYIKFDTSQLVRTSSLLHVTSKDGMTWKAPVVVATISSRGTDPCVQSLEQVCGIGDVTISKTASGQEALLYGVLNADGTKQIFFTTKLPGKKWITPASINTSNYAPYQLELVAAGKGFVATWEATTGYNEPVRLMSAFSTGLTAKSWTAPQERRNTSNLRSLGLLQTSPTKYAVVYSEPTGTPSELAVFTQTFDTRTNRFGAAQQILTLTNVSYLHSLIATEYRAGQSALLFSTYSSSSDGNNARYILFRNGAATAQWVNQALATPDDVYQAVQGASIDSLGHLSIVWLNNNPADSATSLFLSQYFRGNHSDVVLGQESANYNVGFSQDGDVYVSSFFMSTISGFVRIRSDAPTLTTDVALAGTSKVGKALTTKLPMIDADSVGQKWLYSYQWYSCQFQVTEVLAIATENCSAISGATASSYKVKPADKGKFLQVKLSVKSDNATQVQFSASTLAVK
ncbi:MAG: hypothetical protein F2587_05520 [Actinobacteria bacterium]|uniref:Unannotated protein n=1 Tax=freshwater metagenome TaxID=449393 RepID=A0A6J6HNJ7_9ZZZZ|nr:hypothetical protein [Actinomycetota bacterium]